MIFVAGGSIGTYWSMSGGGSWSGYAAMPSLRRRIGPPDRRRCRFGEPKRPEIRHGPSDSTGWIHLPGLRWRNTACIVGLSLIWLDAAWVFVIKPVRLERRYGEIRQHPVLPVLMVAGCATSGSSTATYRSVHHGKGHGKLGSRRMLILDRYSVAKLSGGTDAADPGSSRADSTDRLSSGLGTNPRTPAMPLRACLVQCVRPNSISCP